MPEIICAQCKKQIKIANWEAVQGRKFCSRRCYWDSLKDRDPQYYKNMGNKSSGFPGPHSEETKKKISDTLKGRPNPRMRELALSQVGEKHPRWAGARLRKRRGRQEAVKLFDEQPCERCGSDEYIHRHHIDEDTHNNSQENIQFLCASCHTKEHQKRRISCQ